MEAEEMERRQSGRIEQHIGTILQTVVVALLGWSLITTQSLTRDMAVLQSQVSALTATVNQGTVDRYRGADAAKDFSAVRNELQFIERRVADLESRTRR